MTETGHVGAGGPHRSAHWRLRVNRRSAFSPMRLVSTAAGVLGTLALVAMGASFGVGNLSLQNASAGVVQSFGAKNTTLGTTLQATPGVSTTSGDLLVATIRTRVTSGAAATVSGVTDSAGNTWVKATSVLQGAPNDGEIWYTASAISDTSVTVAVSAGAAVAFTVVEVAGAATTSPLDKTATASGSSTAPAVGPSTTTSQANEIVIADIGWNTSLTPTLQTSGYTVTTAEQSSVSGDNSGEQAAYQILSATGTPSYGATLSAAVAWTGTLATFEFGSGVPTPTPSGTPTPTPTPTPPPSAPHVMVIVEENEEYSSINSSHAPYLTGLANTYASATQWYAVEHNSPTDYLDLIVGSNLNLPNGQPYSNTTLVDELSSSNVPWVSYMESMPSNCYRGSPADGLYDPIHNPFHYFNHYTSSSGGWCSSSNLGTEGVLPYPGSTAMVSALNASNPPDFVFLVPNDCNDMHGDTNAGSTCASSTSNQLITAGDTWLSSNLAPVIASTWFKQNGIIIITWDEGTTKAGCCGLSAPGGHIATIVVAAGNKGKGAFTSIGDHYGTLRAIEEQYGVAKLGASTNTANGDLTGAFGGPTAGTISGTVTNSATNAGISGATVSYSGGTATTDSNGNYTLSAVAPGTYTVTASATGYTTGTASVTVTAGNNSAKNFSLVATSGSISGTALDSQNPAHPVANATISYSGGSATTTTNASGIYTLTGISPGTYTVTATETGYSTGTDTGVAVTLGNTATANFTMPATSSIGGTVLDTESPTGLPVTSAIVAYTGTNGSGSTSAINAVTGAYSLAGVPAGTYTVTASATGFTTVTNSGVIVTVGGTATSSFTMTANSSISGTVTDTELPTGLPIGGATVTYTGTGGTTQHGSTTTASDGTYTLTAVPPGTYTVGVTDSGFATPASKPETVVANTPLTGVNFSMAATGSISGTATDTESPTGLPVAGATVTYTGTGGTTQHGSSTTGSNGTYTLAGVPAGTYSVSIADTGFSVSGPLPETVSGSVITNQNFTLTANSSIGGTLSNSDSSAISNVTVTYTGTNGSTGTGSVTTSTSPYTLAGVPPGTYSVSASEAGFISPPSQNVSVSANGFGTANFVMEAVGSISGTVTHGSVGLQNATVTYTGPDGGGHINTSDSNGDYSLIDVPDGTYSVTASDLVDGSYQPETFTVTVTGTATQTQLFTLSAGSNGSIAGTVTDAQTSLPLANVSVNDGVDAAVLTDSSGNYVIENVAPGSYSVTFTATNHGTGSLSSVSVATDANTQKNIALNEDGTISGTVTDAGTHAAINGATVTCAMCPVTSATTNNSGFYQFTQVPPQSGYTLSVSASGYIGQTGSPFSVTPNTTSTQNFNLSTVPASLSVPETFGAANSGATVTTTVTAVPSTPTGPGDLLVATIKLRVLAAPASTVSIVTDSAGNIWTKGPTVTQGSGLNDEEVWYVANSLTVNNSQTNPGVTVTTTTGAAISFTVLDVAGASAIDQFKTNFGSSSTPQPSVATTTASTQANEIVIGDFGWNGTATMSGETFLPLTSVVTLGPQQSTVTNTKTAEQGAYQIVSSTGTWSFSGTLSATSAWTGIIVTFH